MPSVEPSSTITSCLLGTGSPVLRASPIAASTVATSLKTGMRIVSWTVTARNPNTASKSPAEPVGGTPIFAGYVARTARTNLSNNRRGREAEVGVVDFWVAPAPAESPPGSGRIIGPCLTVVR